MTQRPAQHSTVKVQEFKFLVKNGNFFTPNQRGEFISLLYIFISSIPSKKWPDSYFDSTNHFQSVNIIHNTSCWPNLIMYRLTKGLTMGAINISQTVGILAISPLRYIMLRLNLFWTERACQKTLKCKILQILHGIIRRN